MYRVTIASAEPSRGEAENGGGSMFERFTDRARRVIVLAQEEARMLNHNYIGTEHLLLGLVHEEEGVAARALASLGIGLGAVRQQVEQIVGRGQQAPSGHIPFTSRAKKALDLAQRESSDLGHGFIDTEHLLLGLIREGHGVAAQVLAPLGADIHRVRHQVLSLRPGQAWWGASGSGPRLGKRARSRVLDEAFAQMAAMSQRLAAIERWIGVPAGLEDLDREIAHVRQEKEAAIDSQDFEIAAALRDKERDLLASRTSQEQEQAAAAADGPSLAEEVGRLNAELERLHGILRQHGIDPGGGGDQTQP
jgi:ATP-dependent Clp protease ATP-binding subunit ClpA